MKGRLEDRRLLTGQGRFISDWNFPNQAYAAFLRSDRAHAEIVSVDTAAAAKAPGVLAVLTGRDVAEAGYKSIPTNLGVKDRFGEPLKKPPRPVLAQGKVRHVGECVACVVAESPELAQDAAELIAVEYRELPAVTSAEKALASGAAQLHAELPGNLSFDWVAGDEAATEAAFRAADRVIKLALENPRMVGNPMEPRACSGTYDAATQKYALYACTQGTAGMRGQLVYTMGVPDDKIDVIAEDVGGGFGVRFNMYPEYCAVLLAAKKTGRPVKWTGSRSEVFLSDEQGRDVASTSELALDASGKFLALRFSYVADLGAYLAPTGPFINTQGVVACLTGVYAVPAACARVKLAVTNKAPGAAYRGAGRPVMSYMIERLVDHAAVELGIDPAELRRRNYIAPDAMPFKTALTFTYDSGEFEKGMDLALKLADFSGFEKRRSESRKHGKLRGIGISNTIERAAAGGFEGAEIRFDKSGTATLFAGSVTQGQGHETIFKQIMCDRLGTDPGDVHYVQGDTDQVFIGEGTGGSRSATLGGSAVDLAAERVTAKAKAIAAHLLKVDVNDMNFADGVFSSPKTNRTLTIKEVAKEAVDPSKLPKGMDVGLNATATYVAPVQNFPNGCHVCELEIDEETGSVEIVRYSVVDDVGTVINPLLLKGQIVGGVAQGVGQILMEDIQFDGDGQILTGSFMDYAMPRATDLSAVEVKSNPVPTKTNPLGVKGAGEAGCVGAMPAVANALVDALSHLGVRHVEMPATPERLWRVIQGANAG